MIWRTGRRSDDVGQQLLNLGIDIDNIYNVIGGIIAYYKDLYNQDVYYENKKKTNDPNCTKW